MTVQMRRSRVILSLLLALSSFAASAQEDARAGLPGEGKFFAGGGFGVALSDYDTYIEVSPLIGYRPVPRFDLGLELTYGWSEDLSNYGFMLFADYYVWRGLFARGGYEYLDQEYPLLDGGTDRAGTDAFKLGGGYAIPLGGSVAIYLTALYNFSDDDSFDDWDLGLGVSFGF